MNQALAEDAGRLGLDLDVPALRRLTALEQLLGDRAVPLGLVGQADAGRLYSRHVLDSLRAAVLIEEADRSLLDIGSGAGLPGLVLACAIPRLEVLLVDSRGRAGAFLELAIERLGLQNVGVAVRRVEEVEARVDVCTARAFGPLDRSWSAAYPHLRKGGRLIYFAGEGLEDPQAVARSVEVPASPAKVVATSVIDSFPPMVMMARGG